MTMKIVFIKEYENREIGTEYFVDRPDAIKLCEKGIAVPFPLYAKIQRKKEAEKLKAKAERKAIEPEKIKVEPKVVGPVKKPVRNKK